MLRLKFTTNTSLIQANPKVIDTPWLVQINSNETVNSLKYDPSVTIKLKITPSSQKLMKNSILGFDVRRTRVKII